MTGVTLTSLARQSLHVARPLYRSIRWDVGLRASEISRAHARIAIKDFRHAREDHAVKSASVLGARVAFFQWSTLHSLFHEIYMSQVYRFKATSTSPRIIDAGSNIGLATLWFATAYPGSRILSIEPDPATYELLSENVSANLLANVETLQAALSDKTGMTDFFVSSDSPGSLGMSTIKERMSWEPILVPSIRLSELVSDDIDLLKIDIEGAEGLVVADLMDTGCIRRIDKLIIEVHHNIAGVKSVLPAVLAALDCAGFRYFVSAPRIDGLSSTTASAFEDVMVFATRDGLAG